MYPLQALSYANTTMSTSPDCYNIANRQSQGSGRGRKQRGRWSAGGTRWARRAISLPLGCEIGIFAFSWWGCRFDKILLWHRCWRGRWAWWTNRHGNTVEWCIEGSRSCRRVFRVNCEFHNGDTMLSVHSTTGGVFRSLIHSQSIGSSRFDHIHTQWMSLNKCNGKKTNEQKRKTNV